MAQLDEGRQHRRAIGRASGGTGGVEDCVHLIEQLQLTRDELVFLHLPSLPSSVSPSLPKAQLRTSLSPTATHHMTCSIRRYNSNITQLYFCYHTYDILLCVQLSHIWHTSERTVITHMALAQLHID